MYVSCRSCGGNGGPNWRRDYDFWRKEQDATWVHVGPKKHNRSYASVVSNGDVKTLVFSRLHYPENYMTNFLSSDLPVQTKSVFARIKVPENYSPAFSFVHLNSSGSYFSNSNEKGTTLFSESQAPDSRWSGVCFRCLSKGHKISSCRNVVRCKSCLRYGHVSRFCRDKAANKATYRPVSRMAQPNKGKDSPSFFSSSPSMSAIPDPSSPPSETPMPPHHDSSDATLLPPPPPPPRPSSMANFSVDPRPHLSDGFNFKAMITPREVRRVRAFLGLSCDKSNEDLAIAQLEPPVAKEDYLPMAQALLQSLKDEHHVRCLEIQPCPMGDAYVRFACQLERKSL